MLRTYRRKTALTAAALVAATALLTSCQGGSSDGEESNSSGSSSEESKTESGGGESQDSDDDAETQTGDETSDETGGEKGGGDAKGDAKGVNGTWLGTVSYMAPGKYTVTDMKDTKQAFFTSTSTDIQGTGDICGDADGQAAKPCTEAELEAAAKKGVSAEVEIKDGIAVRIVDDH